MFIGRKQELEFLEDQYRRESASLTFLYGRRRIGKTETLRQFCRNKNHIFFSCTQTSSNRLLEQFSALVLNAGHPASAYIKSFPDWQSLFQALPSVSSNGRIVVVIDEFPYLCKADPSIPSIIQSLWDTQLKNENMMLVLCGSSMSFIEKEILAEKNPLYGRATGIYKMKEMPFSEVIHFFPDYLPEQLASAYAVLGGIPHYLIQWDPNLCLRDNLAVNTLKKGCVLFSETEFLLHQELREPAVYNIILEALASGATKKNDISSKAGIESAAKTNIYLNNLIELSLVEKASVPFIHKKPAAAVSKGLYRLSDSFFRFWYAFPFRYYSWLADQNPEVLLDEVIMPQLDHFTSTIFEKICQEFIISLQSEKKLPFPIAQIGHWLGKTTILSKDGKPRTEETELDLLAVSFDGEKIMAGECKYKNTLFTWKEYQMLRSKLTDLQAEYEFWFTLFSKTGFEDSILREAQQNDHLIIYTLQDIVKHYQNKS